MDVPELTLYKDPDEELDYIFEWVEYLDFISDAISSYQMIGEGVTVNSSSRNGTAITAWVKGGTLNTSAWLTCRIITDGGRTVDRSIRLLIRRR